MKTSLTYLITGARGQLGSEWVRVLKKRDITYYAFGSKELDITDSDKIERLLSELNPDVIVNTAAYTKVDMAEDEPELANQINGKAVETLAVLANKYKSKLIHYSTDYVFPGNIEDKDKFPGGYPEDFQTNPINAYGISKLLGENAIKNKMTDYLIIRISWLCGFFGNNFIKTMMRLGKEKNELRVVNDQFGSPTYTKNVVLNTLTLIHEKQAGIFHLTSNGLLTWFDLTKEIMNQLNYKTKIIPVSSEEYPTKAKRPQFSKLSTRKIDNVAGINLIDWKTGLVGLLNEIEKSIV